MGENAEMSLLAGGAFRLVMLPLGLLVPAVHDQWMIISALSLVGSLASLYLINDAEGAATQTNTNTLMGLTAVSAVVSAYFIAMPSDSGDSGDYYYSDYYGDDDYYGYYGYYY